MNAPQITPWEGAQHPPRAWQADALPRILAGLRQRRPGLVCAVMGSGKSILQAEVIHMATRNLLGRVIVVCVPTTRLVRQLSATVARRLGPDRVGQFYGRRKQIRDVIVTCNPSLPALHLELVGRGLEVALVVVDEAHRSEAAMVRETVPEMRPACLVGFTATPFRSIPRETISLFTEVFYRYTIEDAVRDGVLVPPSVKRWGGSTGTPIDDACLAMMREHVGELGPGIVSARDIADAEAYAAWLTERDWPAEAIHSRQSQTEQDARVERLRTGEVRCLVHVSLLAEGVDLPWLRWLCLRRPVQARVRFLQEVGRALRVHPGKVDAVILDPHLLLGRHGWETAEAIGEALEAAADAEAAEEAGARAPAEPKEHEAVALEVLLAYLSKLRRELVEGGVCEARAVEDGGWQLAPVSRKQVEVVKSASRLTRHIPPDCRDPIKALVKVPWALTRGEASDLLDVLFGGARWARAEAERQNLGEAWRLQWSARQAQVSAEAPDTGECKSVERWGARVKRAEAKRAGAS